MEYFKISLSSNPKVIGVKNGVMQVEICDEEFIATASKNTYSIEQNSSEIKCIKKIKNFKTTDFISYGPVVSFFPFFINDKTLDIIKKHRVNIGRVISVNLENKEDELNKYKLINIPSLDLSLIDYRNTLFYVIDINSGNKIIKKICNKEEHQEYAKSNFIICEKITLSSELDEKIDMFNIGFAGIYISRNLKEIIEKNKLTGINISANMLPTVVFSSKLD